MGSIPGITYHKDSSTVARPRRREARAVSNQCGAVSSIDAAPCSTDVGSSSGLSVCGPDVLGGRLRLEVLRLRLYDSNGHSGDGLCIDCSAAGLA